MSKKSILAETLSAIQEVRGAIEKNANHVLKSSLKEDLEDIIKKGISGMGDEETGEEDNIEDMNPDSENGMGIDLSGGSEPEGMGTEPGIEDTPSDEIPGDEVVDLTDKSDEEVLKRFELMEPTDEIEIVRTGEGIQINFHPEGSGEEGSMEPDAETPGFAPTGLGGGEETEEMPGEESGEESGEEPGFGGDEEEDEEPKMDENEDGVMYEIEIAEESEEGVEESTEEEDEPTVDEVKTTSGIKMLQNKIKPGSQSEDLQEKLVNTRKKLQALVVENKKIKQELDSFKTLKESFQKNEKQYKNAIELLKTELTEVSLFTTNLTHAVKLMTENTTTKDEKYKILSTLDKAKTLDESMQLAATLEEQFKTKKSTSAAAILESKVLDKPGMSSASASINEATVYQNPQIERMKELISRIK